MSDEVSPERRARWLWKLGYLTVAGIFVWMGLERRFALPLVPLLDFDSANYLWPGLLALNGEGFVHNAGLNFIYPGLLFALLRGFGDFRAIVIVQHLLGVAAGLFFLLAWNRLAAFDGASALRRPVHAAIGLVGIGIYLLSPIPIMFELHIRPEAVCMFVQMAWFWLLVEFVFHRRAPANHGKLAGYGIATVASALLLCSLKPSYTLTALLTFALVVTLIFRTRLPRKSLSIFFAGMIAAALLFFVPERFLGRNDRLSTMFLPQTLFAVHANIIQSQMADDLAKGIAVPFARPWLDAASADLAAEIARLNVPSPRQFSLLGFDPDHLMNGEHSIFARWQEQLGSDNELKRFLTYYYWRTVRERPLSFATKIGRQMAVFYAWDCPAFLSYRRILLVAWHYEHSLAMITAADNWAQLSKTVAGVRLRADTEALLSHEVVFNSGKRLFFMHTVLARAYLPLLLVSAGLATWALLMRKRAAPSDWSPLLVIIFFLPNFGNVLGISTIHSMEVLRYSTVQFAAALFAELWAFRYLLGFALGYWERKRPASA
jgi:hypothetical protein